MGREERRNRLLRCLADNHLDEDACGRVAESLRASAAHYGLRPNPSSVLARMIAVADRAGRIGVLAAQDDEQVRLLGQAKHVAKVMEWFRKVNDQAGVVSWARKSLDRISQPGAKALDRLFEMEIAGRLARLSALSVSTGEPDVIADLAESEGFLRRRLRVACKHPDSESGVAACVRKAGEQIVGQGDQGIIMVSLDSVVHQPNRWLSVAAPDVASAWAVRQACRIAQGSDAAIASAFQSPLVLGAVFVLVVPYQIEQEPRSTGFHMGGSHIANHTVPGTDQFLASLVKLLYDAEGIEPR